MTKFLARFSQDESGATAVEYGLILAVLSMVVVAAAGVVGSAINAKFQTLSTKVATAGS